jgi:hypothetical protein
MVSAMSKFLTVSEDRKVPRSSGLLKEELELIEGGPRPDLFELFNAAGLACSLEKSPQGPRRQPCFQGSHQDHGEKAGNLIRLRI